MTTTASVIPVATAPVAYAHGAIADKTFEVTGFRMQGVEYKIGEPDKFGNDVTRVQFYTGFAGCPARYYITTPKFTYIHNA